MKRTKIIVTMGPSIDDERIIEKLIDIGVDVFRFNFSHGTHETHLKSLNKVRNIAKKLGKFVGLLMDLSGPKIRLGNIKEPINVKYGDKITIKYGNFLGDKSVIPLPVREIFDSINANDIFYIADGTIKVKVINKKDDEVDVLILSNGVISSKKGLNFPDVKLKIPSLTEKDKDDLIFGLKNGFDMVALSFVKDKNDVLLAKEIIDLYKNDTPLIAKIEKKDAVDNINEILDVADGIMVARGDLGIEVEMEKVPIIQKKLIKKANEKAKPVITATQMLLSMVKHSRPTRAEVSDIANAVLDGSDAVMLSDETTVGKYPVEAVKVMKKAIEYAETIYPFYKGNEGKKRNDINIAIAESAVILAKDIEANGIVIFTVTGATARRVSSFRPKNPILAITPNEETMRRLSLIWGVIPYLLSTSTNDADKLLKEFLEKISKESGKEKVYVATIGYPSGIPGSTNMVRTIKKEDYDYFLL